MSSQPVMTFSGIPLSLQYLLKSKLMHRMSEALAL